MPAFSPPSFEEQRKNMVERQIKARDVTDPNVLDAMLNIPRHAFVPADQQEYAYQDRPLAIGKGQTISQPYIVAYMTEQLKLQPTDSVLEVGTGSGYQAAILAHISRNVHTIELHEILLENAKAAILRLGIGNIDFHTGDGSEGLPEHGPYDAIMVTAAAPDTRQALLDQLADGGRLIIPVGPRRRQHLELWTRKGDQFERRTVIAVAFVPLRGKFGWQEHDWR